MKKLLLLLALIVPMIQVVECEAKEKGKVKLSLVLTKRDFNPIENDSIADPYFDKFLDTFITCIIHNKTDDEFTIIWEGAKVNGGKVIYNTDRPITMDSRPKADEVVYPHRSSSVKQITSRHNYGGGLTPLYREKDLKNGMTKSIVVTIPIRLKDGKTCVYDFALQYDYIKDLN